MRRDAVHNRERVLAAAEQIFGQHGLDASVDELATAAGVGMGTLYRHFPTKQCLIDEIIGPRRRELVELADRAEDMPVGEGFEWLVAEVGRVQADQPGCIAQLWDHSEAERSALKEFRRRLAILLTEAQSVERIRTEITSQDVSMAFWSVREIVRLTRSVAPDIWKRHIELLLAGMRTPADGSTLQNPSLTATEAAQIMQMTG